MTGLRFLTAGESHGPGLTVIVEGIPAGLALSEEWLHHYLERRQRGFGSGGRMKIEKDRAQILSGVRHGFTLGSPIALWIENKDFANWREAMALEKLPPGSDIKAFSRIVPGHADYPGALKYLHHDLRNVLERASARETAARTSAGAVAARFIEEIGIFLHSHTTAIGSISAPCMAEESIDWEAVEKSETRTADADTEEKFKAEIRKAKREGTTVGGTVQVIAFGVPVGLGSHVHWDRKLDGRIAQAMMSINAVKGVEIGDGFGNSRLLGRDVHDVLEFAPEERTRFRKKTNRAGGIEGGMSNGSPIKVNIAVKPIATMAKPLPSVDINTGESLPAVYNRSDVCQAARACPIAESVLAFTIAQALLEKTGGDGLDEVKRNLEGYKASHSRFGRPHSRPRTKA